MEFSLLGAVAIAVGLLYGTLWYEAGRTNAADCTRRVWDALVAAALGGIAAGRLVAMIRGGVNPLTHPGDIVIVRAGVDTLAAAAAALLVFALVTRRDLWSLADAAAPAGLAGLAGWHAGCVVRAACLGTPSDLPFAVALPGSVITRHPVEIYAALLLAAAAVLLILWKQHRLGPGIISLLAVAAAAGARLVTEPMRPVLGDSLTIWYGIAAVLAVAGALWRRRLLSVQRT